MSEVESIATVEHGQEVQAVSIAGGGLSARVLTWGATLQCLSLDGQDFSVLLGSPEFEAYRNDLLYFGAIVGPVANRIANGRFVMDDQAYTLDRNEDGVTTLHGGSEGFGQRNWKLVAHGDNFVTLRIVHPPALCGFPGPLEVEATYMLLPDRILEIEIVGEAGATALFNPAFHGYWNLDGSASVLDHSLTVAADLYTPVDAMLIPTGLADVDGTAFDFRTPRPVPADIDHNLCVGGARSDIRHIATLEGRLNRLDVESTEPGLQVYSAGDTPSGDWPGLDGKPFGKNAGIALEPQLWPDAPNNPDFPSARIDAGQTVRQVTRFTLTPTNA